MNYANLIFQEILKKSVSRFLLNTDGTEGYTLGFLIVSLLFMIVGILMIVSGIHDGNTTITIVGFINYFSGVLTLFIRGALDVLVQYLTPIKVYDGSMLKYAKACFEKMSETNPVIIDHIFRADFECPLKESEKIAFLEWVKEKWPNHS